LALSGPEKPEYHEIAKNAGSLLLSYCSAKEIVNSINFHLLINSFFPAYPFFSRLQFTSADGILLLMLIV